MCCFTCEFNASTETWPLSNPNLTSILSLADAYSYYSDHKVVLSENFCSQNLGVVNPQLSIGLAFSLFVLQI